MSYVSAGITEEEHRSADIGLRREALDLERRRIEAEKRTALLRGLATFAAAFVPLATFFGWAAFFRGKKS